MKLLERILVPLDFGAQSDCVVIAAIGLAKAFSSEVHLLHVLPSLQDASPETMDLMGMARRGAASRLVEVRSRLQQAGVGTVEGVVAEGVPFDQIIRYSEDIEANVIIVGSRDDDGAAGLRIGTTADRLCRKSSKPVWVVNAESEPRLKRILCPVDCSSPSKRALQNASHLARRFDAQLFVLHVVHPISSLLGLIPSVQPETQKHYVESETSRFEAFLSEFDFQGIRWEKVVYEGTPADTIIAAALEFSVDLLIMGSVGRTGLSRILLGSVATKVARELPSSVVMIKGEDAIRLKLDEALSDLHTRYARGCELLENGLLDEAKRQFEHCIRTGGMFTPAWESLAETCERQGDMKRAQECRETARHIEETLAWRRVEADVRRDHPLWKKS